MNFTQYELWRRFSAAHKLINQLYSINDSQGVFYLQFPPGSPVQGDWVAQAQQIYNRISARFSNWDWNRSLGQYLFHDVDRKVMYIRELRFAYELLNIH